MTPTHDGYLHDLISERCERAATLDSLKHGAYRVILDGNSYRCTRRQPHSPEKHLEEAEKHWLPAPSETPKSPLPGGSIRPIMVGAFTPIIDTLNWLRLLELL